MSHKTHNQTFLNLIQGNSPTLTQDEIDLLNDESNSYFYAYSANLYRRIREGLFTRFSYFPDLTDNQGEAESKWNISNTSLNFKNIGTSVRKVLFDDYSLVDIPYGSSGVTSLIFPIYAYNIPYINDSILLSNVIVYNFQYYNLINITSNADIYYCNEKTKSDIQTTDRVIFNNPSATFVNFHIGTDGTNTFSVKYLPASFTNASANASTFSIPNTVIQLGKKCIPQNLTTLDIPASVSIIDGQLKWDNTNTLTTIYFRQPAGMTVTLPTPGDGTGMCYNKSAYNATIYTDNQTIHDYGWSTDNVTPTFKHLNGTDW